ncbi:hypothetical protein D9M71_514780 [compost metagenome]
MCRWVGIAGDADQLSAAKLHQAPAVDVAKTLGQGQRLAMLQLRQHSAIATVDGGGAQRCVTVQFLEQGTGRVWCVAGAGCKLWIGHQPADGVHSLRRHAFLGDPVGGADEGEVGHQQDGHQQNQQGRQQLLPDREVFQALAQGHGQGNVRIRWKGRVSRKASHARAGFRPSAAAGVPAAAVAGHDGPQRGKHGRAGSATRCAVLHARPGTWKSSWLRWRGLPAELLRPAPRLLAAGRNGAAVGPVRRTGLALHPGAPAARHSGNREARSAG